MAIKFISTGASCSCALEPVHLFLFFLPNVFSFNAYTSLLKSFVKFN